MSRARLPAASRWMMAAALAGVCPLLGLPYLVIALVLLGLDLSLVFRRHARYELVAAMLNAVGLPFVAGSLWPASLLPVLLALPALPWLEESLRKAAPLPAGAGDPEPADALPRRLPGVPLLGIGLPGGRRMTPYLAALAGGLILQALVGLLALRPVLVGTALLLLGFLGVLVAMAWVRIPPGFLTAHAPAIRVLARDTVEAVAMLSSQAQLRAGVVLNAHQPWVKITPAAFATGHGDLRVGVSVTPPLAGPATVTATAEAADPWGLTVLRQGLDLLHLRIIPKALYAAWLAHQYLEQARPGAPSAMTVPEAGLAAARRGLDYYGARLYEPGDLLRDVFWKHTLRLDRLVVKERREAYGEAVILTANLRTQSPEEMDGVAYRLVMFALTLAREGVPVAFAAYTPREVVLVTSPLAPRPAVLEALRLVGRLHLAPSPARRLQAPRAARLRRKIARLRERGTRPASRLAAILEAEHVALFRRARAHPAYHALMSAAIRANGSASVLMVSATLGDASAVEVVLESLAARGVHMLTGRDPRVLSPS